MTYAILKRFTLAVSVLLLAFIASLSMPLGQAQTGVTTLSVVPGWNLVGMGSDGNLDVAATFGDGTKVTTVWKWVPSKSNWAFYAPALVGQQLTDYAAGKGYDVLTTVNAGEGFWVNAKTSFTAPLPAGTALTSAAFRGSLAAGWNLIASGDNMTPSQFNQALSSAPAAFGSIPVNLITLWSWDASLANWYFYAPSLEASGGTALSDYVSSKGYLDYGTKTLDPATGFWVNRSASPTFMALASTSVTSALPMSILTLNGTGFDTTAMTYVRFFDANQYSVDVRPIRVTSASITVAVPPYFNTTSAVFAPGTVSLKVIQSSAAGTRSSDALSGFQILDLPVAAGPAGAVTLELLQSLQSNATALQSSAGAALGAMLGSSLADQASALALLANAAQLVVTDPSKRISLGTYRGASMEVGASELRQTDRLLLGTVFALSQDSTSLASAGSTAIAQMPAKPSISAALKPSLIKNAARRDATLQLAFNGPLDRLAISALTTRLLDGSPQTDSATTFGNELMQLAQASTSGGCMQSEASAYKSCVQQGEDPSVCNSRAIFSAPAQSMLCATPGAFGTSLAVVVAGLAGGVAILALGFGTTAVTGTAGVLALVGYLGYATVLTGMAQIGIGGTLGQTSAAGKQMVVGGLKQLDDFARDTTLSLGVNAAAGKVAGIVNDVVIAALNLNDALPTLSSTTTTTTTTTSTTTTTLIPSSIPVFRGTAVLTGTASKPIPMSGCLPSPWVWTTTSTPSTIELVFEQDPRLAGPISANIYSGSSTLTTTHPAVTCSLPDGTRYTLIPSQTDTLPQDSNSETISGQSDGTNIVIDIIVYDSRCSSTFTGIVTTAPVTGAVQFSGRDNTRCHIDDAQSDFTTTYTLIRD